MGWNAGTARAVSCLKWWKAAVLMAKYSRILLVDDSAITRRVVRKMLEENGYANIDEAADGRQAVALLGQRTYSLVISDWNMAPMSGLELLASIRASIRLKGLPFIMITGNTQKKFASIARDNGATCYLVKPFTAAVLLERVTSVFQSHIAA